MDKDRANALCDALVESGHFEQGKETRSGNKRLTVEYKILSLDPEPKEHIKPILIDIAPPPPEPEPYDGPDPDEYLGNPDEPEPEQYEP